MSTKEFTYKIIILVIGVALGIFGHHFFPVSNDTSKELKNDQVFEEDMNSPSSTVTTEADIPAQSKSDNNDAERSLCIANAEKLEAEFKETYPECSNNLGTYCLSRMPKTRDNINECYFRFPNI